MNPKSTDLGLLLNNFLPKPLILKLKENFGGELENVCDLDVGFSDFTLAELLVVELPPTGANFRVASTVVQQLVTLG